MENVIGKLLDSPGRLPLNVKKLIETRLLVVSNSGGGKSHLLRKIIELCMGQVQVIVLDVEGDFASLRTDFDFILAGKGGDIPADPKLADMLAKKTLELGASLIVDLYELKHHDRIRFVRLFLESMINAPKELWHPVVVVVDEAHIFAPEKGEAESAGAVIDLATRGRKRGFAVLLATQRLSKLHKDAAAECLNKLVGRTTLDIDMKRAADELGFSSRDQAHGLRNLEPGEFFAYGPALTKEVVKVMVGATVTAHPKAGQHGAQRVQAPTAKIKAMLAKLADLPKEAEQEVNDRAALKAKVRELEGRLRQAPKPVVDETMLEAERHKAFKLGVEAMRKAALVDLTTMAGVVSQFQHNIKGVMPLREAKSGPVPMPGAHGLSDVQVLRKPAIAQPAPTRKPVEVSGDKTFGRGEMAILGFLASRGMAMTKTQVGAITGYAPGGGSFNTYLSRLATAGLIQRQGSQLHIPAEAMDQVREMLGPDYKAPGAEALQEWIGRLGKGERDIFKVVMDAQGPVSKEQIGEATGYESKGGSFNTYLSRLATLGLIVRQGGNVELNPELRSL